MHDALVQLMYGFGIALQPDNLMWCVFGVLVGNLIGVLPGMGPLSTISMLLPIVAVIAPVPGILMLAGIFYGSQYGGAIGAILLNLPSHPPHAVTCLDGYPLTLQGRGGTALGITMMSSFFAASVGIVVMIFLSPLLVKAADSFGPADICAIMLLGLLAGATMARGSPLKGVAMTILGMLFGLVGDDEISGTARYTLGMTDLRAGVELGGITMGLFGIADFLVSVNRTTVNPANARVSMRDMRPSRAEIRQAFWPMVRGTGVGTAFGALPGTGPTITTFLAYALERRISRTPGRFGKGALEGVAAPEAASHSKTQVDFIPTMSLGIPGDAVMALLLGALILKGVQPGPQLISDHPDIFWGLIASFWVGNLLLLVLNIPLIGMWVRLLTVPYRLIYPCVLFFICIGVYSGNNNLFDVGVVLAIGVGGYFTTRLGFEPAPVLLGFVLGPMVEENFRRALLLSRGDPGIFVTRPISAAFVLACCLMLAGVAYSRLRKGRPAQRAAG